MYPRRRWSLWTVVVTLLAWHSSCHATKPALFRATDVWRETNKSVFSFLRQLTTWHCLQLLLRAGHAAIDRYLLPVVPKAANPPHGRAAAEWYETNRRTRGQTDGRMDARQFHIDSVAHASSANNILSVNLKHPKTKTHATSVWKSVFPPTLWND